MPDTTTEDTSRPASLAPRYPACDYEGCEQPATHSYVWDWGDGGHCCQQHVAAHSMTARNLKRTVQFAALAASAPVELTRQQRIDMNARVLAAEQEADEVNAKSVELYNANVQLANEIKRQSIEVLGLQAQVRDLAAELEQTRSEKMKALTELGAAKTELARLQGILHAREVTPVEPG